MATWSRLVRFQSASSAAPLIGEPVDQSLDVGLATFEGKPVEVRCYSGQSILDAGEPTGETATVSRLLSPLAEEEVGTIRCIGLNVSLRLFYARLLCSVGRAQSTQSMQPRPTSQSRKCPCFSCPRLLLLSAGR